MRRIVLTALVALLVVSAGCVGLITGETVEFEASNSTMEADTLESTGYEANNTTERSLTRDVTFLGQERTIRVVNHVTSYTKSGTLDAPDNGTLDAPDSRTLSEATNRSVESEVVPDIARFVVLSTPGAEVLGQTLNPAANWGNERILAAVADQTGQLNGIEQDGRRTTASLGEERNVTEFTATTEMEGQEVDVQVHVASFEHEGDVIIAIGVHPEYMDESDNVDELLGGIEHTGD